MKYEILDKTGKNKRCTVTSLEYNGEFMGESYVLCKVESEVPIDFQTGDYLEYRGEKYEINYDPSVLKKCRANYKRRLYIRQHQTEQRKQRLSKMPFSGLCKRR